MENIKDGTKNRNKALSFVGDNTIHKAKHAQISVLNIKGIIIDSPGVPGIIKTRSVIPKYAAINPPKIEVRTLNKPIFFPLFSGIDSCLYIFFTDIKKKPLMILIIIIKCS